MSEKNHESPNKEEKIPMGKIICAWCKRYGRKSYRRGIAYSWYLRGMRGKSQERHKGNQALI